MKVNRKYKVSTRSDTFSLPLILSKSDVARVLRSSPADMFDEALPHSSWVEIIGRMLGCFGTDFSVLSCWRDLGKWGVSVAERERLLVRDGMEDNLLLRNTQKLEATRPGPAKATDGDDEQ